MGHVLMEWECLTRCSGGLLLEQVQSAALTPGCDLSSAGAGKNGPVSGGSRVNMFICSQGCQVIRETSHQHQISSLCPIRGLRQVARLFRPVVDTKQQQPPYLRLFGAGP